MSLNIMLACSTHGNWNRSLTTDNVWCLNGLNIFFLGVFDICSTLDSVKCSENENGLHGGNNHVQGH